MSIKQPRLTQETEALIIRLRDAERNDPPGLTTAQMSDEEISLTLKFCLRGKSSWRPIRWAIKGGHHDSRASLSRLDQLSFRLSDWGHIASSGLLRKRETAS